LTLDLESLLLLLFGRMIHGQSARAGILSTVYTIKFVARDAASYSPSNRWPASCRIPASSSNGFINDDIVVTLKSPSSAKAKEG
jgi:hypothetical protein